MKKFFKSIAVIIMLFGATIGIYNSFIFSIDDSSYYSYRALGGIIFGIGIIMFAFYARKK